MSYTSFLTRRLPIAIFFCLWASALFAAVTPYQAGKVVDIEQKVNTRILYYLVNTPVTKDEPYYDVSVLVEDATYVGEYTPRHAADTLPEDVVINGAVQVRIEKRHMFLKRPDGGELDFVIIKRLGPKPEANRKQSQPAEH